MEESENHFPRSYTLACSVLSLSLSLGGCRYATFSSSSRRRREVRDSLTGCSFVFLDRDPRLQRRRHPSPRQCWFVRKYPRASFSACCVCVHVSRLARTRLSLSLSLHARTSAAAAYSLFISSQRGYTCSGGADFVTWGDCYCCYWDFEVESERERAAFYVYRRRR